MAKERICRCGGREHRIAGSEVMVVEVDVFVVVLEVAASPLAAAGESCWILELELRLMIRTDSEASGLEGSSGESEGSKSSRERLAILWLLCGEKME